MTGAASTDRSSAASNPAFIDCRSSAVNTQINAPSTKSTIPCQRKLQFVFFSLNSRFSAFQSRTEQINAAMTNSAESTAAYASCSGVASSMMSTNWHVESSGIASERVASLRMTDPLMSAPNAAVSTIIPNVPHSESTCTRL